MVTHKSAAAALHRSSGFLLIRACSSMATTCSTAGLVSLWHLQHWPSAVIAWRACGCLAICKAMCRLHPSMKPWHGVSPKVSSQTSLCVHGLQCEYAAHGWTLRVLLGKTRARTRSPDLYPFYTRAMWLT